MRARSYRAALAACVSLLWLSGVGLAQAQPAVPSSSSASKKTVQDGGARTDASGKSHPETADNHKNTTGAPPSAATTKPNNAAGGANHAQRSDARTVTVPNPPSASAPPGFTPPPPTGSGDVNADGQATNPPSGSPQDNQQAQGTVPDDKPQRSTHPPGAEYPPVQQNSMQVPAKQAGLQLPGGFSLPIGITELEDVGFGFVLGVLATIFVGAVARMFRRPRKTIERFEPLRETAAPEPELPVEAALQDVPEPYSPESSFEVEPHQPPEPQPESIGPVSGPVFEPLSLPEPVVYQEPAPVLPAPLPPPRFDGKRVAAIAGQVIETLGPNPDTRPMLVQSVRDRSNGPDMARNFFHALAQLHGDVTAQARWAQAEADLQDILSICFPGQAVQLIAPRRGQAFEPDNMDDFSRSTTGSRSEVGRLLSPGFRTADVLMKAGVETG